MEIPASFLERMEELLGEEYPAFAASMEEKHHTGLRVNTGRLTAEELQKAVPFALEAVPWVKNGFYYEEEDRVTHHPAYYAGLYYIQEPSAMIPASILPVKPGDRVLDLCAAPGGKATELAARLNGEGLLLANDISASRAKALLKNLELFGVSNCMVSAEEPENLAEAYPEFFDKILIDAPCSGEGMFRRDSGMVRDWLERGPAYYAPIQKRLLELGVRMLAPGGYLVYSTCTFSEEEDEGQIRGLLEAHPELSLVRPGWQEGFSEGLSLKECVRIWPHRAKGEGHFAALLQKRGEEGRRGPAAPGDTGKKLRPVQEEKLDGEARSFIGLLPERLKQGGQLFLLEDQLYLIPVDGLRRGIHYLRTGLSLGTVKRGRFAPSQALAMALKKEEFPAALDLEFTDERLLRYLKGETISMEDEQAKGWILLCAGGYPVGWGKAGGGTVKNKYCRGWRMQA